MSDCDQLPDSVREVENDTDAQSYIRFPVTDVLEYYTVYDDGTIQREVFIAEPIEDTTAVEDYMKGSHAGHDVEPFAQAHDTKAPKVHEGIFWCNDCDEEFVPDAEPPARTL